MWWMCEVVPWLNTFDVVPLSRRLAIPRIGFDDHWQRPVLNVGASAGIKLLVCADNIII